MPPRRPAAKPAPASTTASSTSSTPPQRPPQRQKKQLTDLLPSAIQDALFTQRFFLPLAALCLLADAVLTLLIIKKVSYTEIDFSTYMQQAGLFLKGERDYSRIQGDTGPCVYPAGHLYVYAALYRLTDGGQNLLLAQYIFGGLYLVSQGLVMAIYSKIGAPGMLLPILLLSKRLHSIYALRMFNDGVAMTVMWAAVLLLMHRKYTAGVIFTSLALSVKMNILLFIPALAIIIFRAKGVVGLVVDGLAALTLQVVLSLPFIQSNPQAYVTNAFNLGRQFLYQWTVNLRFLPEEVFLDRRLGVALLVLHLSIIAAFTAFCWTGLSRQGMQWIHRNLKGGNDVTPRFVALSLFTSNLVGILCSRSLHYQFYAWYAQTLPLLFWYAELKATSRVILPLAVELAWNTYPSTSQSSILLMAANALLVLGMFRTDFEKEEEKVLRRGFAPPSSVSPHSTRPGTR